MQKTFIKMHSGNAAIINIKINIIHIDCDLALYAKISTVSLLMLEKLMADLKKQADISPLLLSELELAITAYQSIFPQRHSQFFKRAQEHDCWLMTSLIKSTLEKIEHTLAFKGSSHSNIPTCFYKK